MNDPSRPQDRLDPVADLYQQLQQHEKVVEEILHLSEEHPGALDDALLHINTRASHVHRDIVRVFRVIQYVGDRTWVEKTILGSIHGSKVVPGKGAIYVSTLQEFPEIISYVPVGWDLNQTFREVDTEEDPSDQYRRHRGLDVDAT